MSTKTIAEKLAIKPNSSFWTSHESRFDLVGPLPEGVRTVSGLEQAAVALLFADDSVSLRNLLETHKGGLTQPQILWVAYPKANRIDLNRDTLWPIVGEYGLRPNGQVAIDDVWSALRFRPLKIGEEPFTGGQ